MLEVAYLEYGAADGWPCIMGHGFPYDAHAYDEAAPMLAESGARVIVPWLRGYGRDAVPLAPTRRARASRRRWAPTCWR